MKTVLHNLFYLFICLTILSCNNESETEGELDVLDPSLYYEELNISYGNDHEQTFNLYLPSNRSTITKVMVLVHGGGWISGDKNEMNLLELNLQ